MRRIIIILLALLVVGSVLAACGGANQQVTPLPTLGKTVAAPATQTPSLPATATSKPTATTLTTEVPTGASSPPMPPTMTTKPQNTRPKVEVIVDELRGYNAPGGTLIGVALKGQKMHINGRNATGEWLRLCCFDNRNGWARADGVRLLAGDLNVVPTVALPTPTQPSSQQSPLQTPSAVEATPTSVGLSPTPTGKKSQWVVLAPSAVGPAPRRGGVFLAAPDKQQLYLFGGKGQQGFLGDLWQFDLKAKKWEALSPEGGPSPRSGASGVWDSVRKQIIIAGGLDATGYRRDVWAYRPEASQWQKLASTSDAKVPGRAYAAAAYDPVHDALFWFGGQSVDGDLSDTWRYQIGNNKWEIAPAGSMVPAARYHAAAAYDIASQQVILFGGCSSPPQPCPRGDTWSYDVVDQMWQQYVPQPVRPQSRQQMGIAFDQQHNLMLLYGGGNDSGQAFDDLWAFQAISGSWRLVASGSKGPGSRYGAMAAWIADPPRFILFGGIQGSAYLSDLWALPLTDLPSP